METSGRTWTEGNDAKSVVTTFVRVPPDRVFEYVSDMPRHREWALDEITIVPITPAPPQMGSKYHAVGKQFGKEWPSDLAITAYEPPHRFEFTAAGGPLPTPQGDPHHHEFLFSSADGGTRLEVRRTDPKLPNWPGWFWRLAGPLAVHSSLRKRIETVERLRQCLDEQGM